MQKDYFAARQIRVGERDSIPAVYLDSAVSGGTGIENDISGVIIWVAVIKIGRGEGVVSCLEKAGTKVTHYYWSAVHMTHRLRTECCDVITVDILQGLSIIATGRICVGHCHGGSNRDSIGQRHQKILSLNSL